jgi:nucleotide-binding universal stress UspA family protein
MHRTRAAQGFRNLQQWRSRLDARRGAIAFSVLDQKGARGMRKANRPVVVLVERNSSDDDVMREARARAAALGAPLVLVHVAQLERDVSPWSLRWHRGVEPWQQMLGIEATVSYDLRLLARQWVGAATPVDVVVRFGDAVTELTALARARAARLVVAGSRPARWPLGQGRDRRLRRTLDAPLALVRSPRVSRWAEWLDPIPAEARWRP